MTEPVREGSLLTGADQRPERRPLCRLRDVPATRHARRSRVPTCLAVS